MGFRDEIRNRMKGAQDGVVIGLFAPFGLLTAFSYLTVEKFKDKGPGPAIAMIAIFVLALAGLVTYVGGSALAAALSFSGIPWYITMPVAYFSFWAFFGAILK